MVLAFIFMRLEEAVFHARGDGESLSVRIQVRMTVDGLGLSFVPHLLEIAPFLHRLSMGAVHNLSNHQ